MESKIPILTWVPFIYFCIVFLFYWSIKNYKTCFQLRFWVIIKILIFQRILNVWWIIIPWNNCLITVNAIGNQVRMLLHWLGESLVKGFLTYYLHLTLFCLSCWLSISSSLNQHCKLQFSIHSIWHYNYALIVSLHNFSRNILSFGGNNYTVSALEVFIVFKKNTFFHFNI